jgi:SH3 domain protein
MYITDKVEASVRTGKGYAAGSQYLDLVRTGDKVEVVATEGEYVRVVIPSGKEGWLHSRYVTAVQPENTEKLKEKVKTISDEMAKVKEEKTELETVRDQQAVKLKESEQAYETLKSGCSDFMKVQADVDKAQQELRANSEVIAQLQREKEDLEQNTQLIWFISGAAAVLSGFLIGMWLQGVRKKRKSKFSF